MPPPPGLIARSVSYVRIKYRGLKALVSKPKADEASIHELDEETDSTRPSPDTQLPTNGNRKHSWTLKHGSFACMGGVGLHIPPLPDSIRFLPDKSDEARYLMTTRGMEFLARFPDTHKSIPDLSVKDINALSRASAFAKFVVCCQAIWFICQSILKHTHRLLISLLELNTFAHAICVLLAYVFWWVSVDISLYRSIQYLCLILTAR